MTALLQIEGLRKRFGGLLATDDVSLVVRPGEVHALIGPNGAGKTTLVGQIMGDIRPDAGRIVFAGHDLLPLRPPRRAALGLARTFQITQLLMDETARDNVSLAVQSGAGHSFRFWRTARTDRALTQPADAALASLGLLDRAHVRVADLAQGERKQLELAIALATRPRLLLLDEPMAGLGPAESNAMTATLQALKARIPMLLIEHDMAAVFALADRITVLVDGAVVASGPPEAIRTDPAVRAAYLSDDA